MAFLSLGFLLLFAPAVAHAQNSLQLVFEDDFNTLDATNWLFYAGAGYAGNGLRSPSALSIQNGHLVITAQENALGEVVSGGLQNMTEYTPGDGYVFQARLRVDPDPSKRLSGKFILAPQDGVVDHGEMRIWDTGQGAGSNTIKSVVVNSGIQDSHDWGDSASDWHTAQVRWTATDEPFRLDDGFPWKPYLEFTNPHHLAFQLDASKSSLPQGATVRMFVSWVRIYKVVPGPSTDPVVMAAGDYNGTSGPDPDAVAVANVIRSQDPYAILDLGDSQYGCDPASDLCLENGFHQAMKAGGADLYPIIYPTPGPTHDIDSCSSIDSYLQFWTRQPYEPYSFDVPLPDGSSWHIISLPSSAYRYGCDTTSILSWLVNDLQAHKDMCTLAYWHEPYFSRSTSTHDTEGDGVLTEAVRPWMDALYNGGADIVLSGHQHNYQQFAPMRPDAALDQNGLREFVVGTGGVGFYPFNRSDGPNLEVSNADTYGALRLVLHTSGYDADFLPAGGGSFSAHTSGSCH
jgi:hypothetical protein